MIHVLLSQHNQGHVADVLQSSSEFGSRLFIVSLQVSFFLCNLIAMTHCFLSLQRYSSSSNGEYSTNFMLHFCSTSSERQIFVRQLQLLVTIQIAFVFNTFLSSKIHESTRVYFKVQSSGLMLNGTFMPLCEKATKLVTTVQICVSTFVSMKILDIFQDISGQFPAVFVAKKLDILRQEMTFS